jgi:hypothetical protein
LILKGGRSGGRGRDRTYDQSIKSRMLYQLSYASFWFLLLEGRSVRALFARVHTAKTAIT